MTSVAPDDTSEVLERPIEEVNQGTHANIPVTESAALAEALGYIARRRAAEIAITSVNEMAYYATQEDKFGVKSREFTELKTELVALNAQAELDIMQTLNKMDTETMLHFVFRLVDLDKSNNITLHELAHVLQLIRGGEDHANSSEEALRAAELTITANDSDGDGCLDCYEFGDFIISMGEFLGKTVESIAYFLVMEITSLYDGAFITDEVTDLLDDIVLSNSNTNEVEEHGSLTQKVRLYIIFELIKSIYNVVEFFHVFDAMESVSNHMEEDFSRMLAFIKDDNKHKELSKKKYTFSDFFELFENVIIPYMPDLDVIFLANIMTANLCRRITHESRKGQDGTTDRTSPPRCECSVKKEICNGDKKRIYHLFNLWDKKNGGTLDISTVFSGFREFHELKDSDENTCDIISKMEQAQEVKADSQNISVDQFGKMLLEFAAEVGVELSTMVDFMYMETLIKVDHDPSQSNEGEVEKTSFVKRLSFRGKSMNTKATWLQLIHNLADEEVQT
mmetsp:Transcript_15278/g.23787  ORF Transcript_15278/g.23787 Transcript_15278/m.23787 type:complete len:508 (+) Transcript_15278:192-1715(+)|eukprot:CAMPEP_0195302526 /NCGR_PEP_ID=MMETSP0707-20130614/31235_1 /TAXON_ID=33640 /ORGANISM="Asterionellopsis glacialis, Strain CCMP134" /LENGTH=507 /DNA_ID=CAMNT_0040365805 /DNA_START=171 /DNA_END=1694 /DNA_ORIENTATION=+